MYTCLTPSNGSPVDQICDWEVVKLAVCVLKNIFPIALLQVKLACQGFLVTRTASKKVRNLRGLQGCSSRVCRHAQQRWRASSQSRVTPKEFTCSTSELRWSTEATCLHIDYVSPTSHHRIWFFWRNPSRRRQCHRTALQGQGYREKERKPTFSHILQPLGCRQPSSQKPYKAQDWLIPEY